MIIRSPIRDVEYGYREPELGEHEFIFDTNTDLETIRRRVIAIGKRPMVQVLKNTFPSVSDPISKTQIRVTNRAILRAEVYKEANEIWQLGKRLGVTVFNREDDILNQLVEMEIGIGSRKEIKIPGRERESSM